MSSLRLTLVFVFLGVLFIVAQSARSDPVIVYDNTSHGTGGSFVPEGLPWGFWPFNQFAPNELMGDQITLAGSERVVTQFDLVLSSSEPTTLASLVFRLYGFDGNAFSPGTPIWTTTLMNVLVDGNTIVPISVPDVPVPDTLVWVAGADSNTAGLATFSPPTVGASSKFWYWDLDSYTLEWYALAFEGDPAANFGARVLAVPEPATAALLPLAWLLTISRSRRRSRDSRRLRRRSGSCGGRQPRA